MNYSETLDYLYNKLPMFTRVGSIAFRKGLDNTLRLCEFLGNPQEKFKAVHIAGTNGKGSVSHMLAAVTQTAGYKTGLYTSPHLYDFRERIKVNGHMAEEAFVIAFVEKIKPLIDEIEPSFFEITVAMAFDYFAQQGVEIAIVEVGLGGRLDSTNIINPLVSIITNIGYDHMNMLGNTLPEIAGEKAGIIKQNTPVIIGEKDDETKQVFLSYASKKNAPIQFAEDFYKATDLAWNDDLLQLNVNANDEEKNERYSLDLTGNYQAKNIVTVLQAIQILKTKGFDLKEEQVKQGLQNAKKLTGLHGRWEVVQQQPTVVLEVAHNEPGIQELVQHINRLNYHQLHIVFGMVKDKEADKILRLLPADAAYYFTQAHIPRALDKHELQMQAQRYNLKGMLFENVNTALQKALETAMPDDLIIVCGSIFLVAEVDRTLLSQRINN
jgi:dihydrofolate synthase / folylpolyglutamate synthase